MARIRTVKPEFWSSPDTAACADPWARLLFISMWNWADDTGRGTANPKELAGFAFPNDDDIDSMSVRRMLGEVSRAFGVILYKVGGRTYYAIPSWDDHQKIDRKSGAKHPGPEGGEPWDPDPDRAREQQVGRQLTLADPALDEPSTNAQRALDEPSGTGTGEQGNRGSTTSSTAAAPDHEANSSCPTDEAQSKATQRASEPPRDDVEAICTRLRDLVAANLVAANGPDTKTPTVTHEWRRQARLMLDIDKRELSKVLNLIEWCQADTFWQSNVMSVPKLRQQYDQLALKARQEWSQGKAGRNGNRIPLRERLKGGAA